MGVHEPGIQRLTMPDVTHIAIYRNAWGLVTARRLLFLPLASDDDANMAASSMRGALDVYCDVFEIHGSHRTGGWMFRQESEL